jgi:hypothetical protein
MILAAALAATVLAGWGLGRRRPGADPAMCIFAVFGAVTAHSMLQYAFILEGRLDQVFGDPRRGAPEVVMVLIAAIEAAGLWLPVLLIPWARGGARAWGALYALASATVAAAYHYFPFDLVVVSDELVAPDGPPYLLAVFVLLPAAAVGYLVGRSRVIDDSDDDRELTDAIAP